jgi:paired amphipathic helix protein Sin3a
VNTFIIPNFIAHRNIQQQPLYHMKSNMEYKICRNTYHLFYVIGTEDSVVCKKNQDVLFNEAEDKNKRFQSWLNSKNNNSE